MTSRTPSPLLPGRSNLRVSRALIEPILPHASRIRNVCILAHVDHGKTTLTDSLIASNGIISFKQAGKLRYMDSREDEQERGITMEASAIALLFDHKVKALENSAGLDIGSIETDCVQRHLINLIDSPGHVDFSRQVVTAARLCDGCLVLVDAVEGVCTQTMAVLRQAHRERLKLCLVINKVDRLITELKLTSEDAFMWLYRLVEQVNAVQATISTDFFDETGNLYETTIDGDLREGRLEQTVEPSVVETRSDQNYFDPLIGNVVFASSTDGWAFGIEKFVDIFSKRLKMRSDVLRKTLWGEFFFDPKNKAIVSKKVAGKLGLSKPLFSQFILDSIWAVYESTLVKWDEPRIEKICAQAGAIIPPREMKMQDGKVTMRTIFSQWLPIADAVFTMIVGQIPSPLVSNIERLETLFPKSLGSFECCKELLQKLKVPDFFNSEPAIAFISKLIPVSKRPVLPIRTSSPIAQQESFLGEVKDDSMCLGISFSDLSLAPSSDSNNLKPKNEFVGMARLFHGTLSVGQKVYVLGPKHTPGTTDHAFEFAIQELFLLMGRDMEPVQRVYSGSVFGIGGDIASHIGKSGTLSTSLDCPSLMAMKGEGTPIVKVAIRPSRLEDLPDVLSGLEILCQADPCAEAYLQEESGEFVLATAGELHLEQCLKDLTERYTRSDVNLIVSPPMVPFRETLTQERNRNEDLWKVHIGPFDDVDIELSLLTLISTDGRVKMSARAIPIPNKVVSNILAQQNLIRNIMSSKTGIFDDETMNFLDSLVVLSEEPQSVWKGIDPSMIWSFGPRINGPNLLLSRTNSANTNLPQKRSLFHPDTTLAPYASSILAAFRLITEKGPLAQEPMMGVAFILERFELLDVPWEPEAQCKFQALASANLISLTKTVFEASFLFWSPRLMLAYYKCSIQTNADMLGKVYAALNKRHGKISSEEYIDGTGFFTVNALLPVVESFGFCDDLRGRTAGIAIPQLLFAGFQVLDQDPYWMPVTDEELEEFGATSNIENLALRYLLGIRERKGLFVERKVVLFAEKQRTLKR